jgi:hypothetical protein
MSFGIALHMKGAELNVGVGEEALVDRHQTREVILDKKSSRGGVHARSIPVEPISSLQDFRGQVLPYSSQFPFCHRVLSPTTT